MILNKKIKGALYGAFCVIITLLSGCSNGAPQISLTETSLVPSSVLIGRASAYMKITNSGTGSDALTGCRVKEYTAARCEIHDIKDSKMVMINSVGIPAEHTVELGMKKAHLMLFNLPEKLAEDVALVLLFDKSPDMEVNVRVSAMAGHDMPH